MVSFFLVFIMRDRHTDIDHSLGQDYLNICVPLLELLNKVSRSMVKRHRIYNSHTHLILWDWLLFNDFPLRTFVIRQTTES